MEEIRVIIAEDEPPIARFIRSLTQQSGAFRVVAMCESGEEALEAVKRLHPQLLITDIRMGGIDGLKLIRKIRDQDQEMRVIIISGYKMFEYAREAVSLGIEDYITKPVEPETFAKTLEGVRKYYLEEDKEKQQWMLEKALRTMDRELFDQVMGGKLFQLLMVYKSGDMEEQRLRLSRGGQEERIGSHILVVGYKNAFLYLQFLEDREEGERFSFQDMDSGDRTGLYPGKGAPGRDRLRRILELAGGGTVAGILIEKMDAEELIDNIDSIYRSVRRLAVPGKKRKGIFSGIGEVDVQDQCEDEKQVKKIQTAIQAGNWKSFCEAGESLFDLWEKEGANVYQMKTVLHIIVAMIRQTGIRKDEDMLFNEYVDDCIRYSDSYQEMKESILSFLEENIFKKSGRENGGKDGKQLFETIIQLIEKNHNMNYSLQEISTRYGVSQPYIRKIFKHYTGATYNEYVLGEKIKISLELMKLNPDILIKDVADAIGFDQLYFSTVFNKNMGMTPSQYRLGLLEQQENKSREEGVL